MSRNRWSRLRAGMTRILSRGTPHLQSRNRSIYWDSTFAEELSTWGAESVWPEIRALFVGRNGKVLDIACGSGEALIELSELPGLEMYGFDFSEPLIRRASQNVQRIKERLESPADASHGVCWDARLLLANGLCFPFRDKSFEYSYSIGSLEHFAEDEVPKFLKEASRVTRIGSFHQLPICRKGDEGWISPNQSYFNNSVEWWLPKFEAAFERTLLLPSSWADERSVGKWFVCVP